MGKLKFLLLCTVLAIGTSSSGCVQKLKPEPYGPVDPAGGKPGPQKTIFVKPPYRALDAVNVTGQDPLRKSGNRTRSGQAESK